MNLRRMFRILACTGVVCAAFAAAPAMADPWRDGPRHPHHGPRVVYAPPPVYYAPPAPVVYAPPPVYYVPPPPPRVVYAPPPVYYAPAPSASLSLIFPLR